MATSGDVVLVTGGSGFLGQHLIKLLLEKRAELGICEIRSVDLQPYKNNIGHQDASPTLLRTYVADICERNERLDEAFSGVDGVFHCAANVSIQYPPDYATLERVNVDGTRNIVELCVQHNVKRLVYTSCCSVCFVSFKGQTFSVVFNQTESKTDTPRYDCQNIKELDRQFLIPGYAASKLRAEQIVLNSNGAPLANQHGYLATCAIRAPLTYGECDGHFITNAFAYLSKHGYVFPRVAGTGGKQQLVYAGNVAWGHVCAYKTLKTSDKAVNGLPVFVTDDTGINDVSRFVQKMALLGQRFKVNQSFWYLPHFVYFFLVFLCEFFVKLLLPFTKKPLRFSLRAIASFTSSVLMYNRLRASIHMDYVPLVDPETAAELSAKWYAKWWDENIGAKKRTGKKSS